MPIQTFTATVLDIQHLTSDVIKLSLTRPDDFQFKAGQFINLKIEQNENSRFKSYSILSPPSQTSSLDLCIKIVPGGFASEIFKTTKKDDTFEVKGPFGHFVFDDQTASQNPHQDHIFLGAGTGVAPFYSMITEFLSQFPTTQFHLFFGTKTEQDLFLKDEFIQLERQHPNFTFTPVLSREPNTNHKKGHVQDHLPSNIDDLKNKTFYICGLKELVLETKELLLSRGVEKTNIKFERYS